MPEENSLPIPVEVPWRLASTTQNLKEGFPDDTTISIFYYEPVTESLRADYPDERLIYLKFTVSISPCQIRRERFSELARGHLVGGLPVLHVVLDVAVTPDPFEAGVIRPYFHTAAPIRRTMVETGVVGDSFYEGESESLAFGKSASQLHETVSSQVTTKSKGWSLGLPGIVRGGKQTTSTTVDSARSVEEYLETTNREASAERRELLSHMTHVENILTLLTAKHVGSPFLRFSLSPRPLRPLTVDPGDPNLWYSQLLHHRSSGIEGIQEFFAIVAVPRDTNFCVQALLRRICVLDDPPVPPAFPVSQSVQAEEVTPIFVYLHRLYPVGTPLDELDVDALGSFDGDVIPTIDMWHMSANSWRRIVFGEAVYPSPSITSVGMFFVYKAAVEVRRDMLMDEYLEDLSRSPLERGVVMSHSTQLRTCFRRTADSRTEASRSEAPVPQVSAVPFEPGITFTAPQDVNRRSMVSQNYPTETVTRWNALDEQLAAQVPLISDHESPPLSLNHPKMIQLFLRLWKKMRHDDLRNLSLDRVAAMVKLSPHDISLLEKAGVKNLKGFAEVLLSAPAIERIANERNESIARMSEKERCSFDLKPIEYPLTSVDVNRMGELLGAALEDEDENDGHYAKDNSYKGNDVEKPNNQV
jgi:hypothetical protein